LAEELDVELGLRTVAAVRDELARLAPGTVRPHAPTTSAQGAPRPEEGQAVLATWHELLDAGRAQDGDEHLAGTAKPARALMSLVTATSHGLSAGEQVAVSTERGAVVVPIEIADLPDQVVWLPSNARHCAVRATLGAAHGSIVTLTNPSAPPVVGGGADA
jgi:NADH-quinone oxidoreductase subunit G